MNADTPHRFRPLVITDRPPKGMRLWLRFNIGILPADVPCLVCGGSMMHPVHYVADWKPPAGNA